MMMAQIGHYQGLSGIRISPTRVISSTEQFYTHVLRRCVQPIKVLGAEMSKRSTRASTKGAISIKNAIKFDPAIFLKTAGTDRIISTHKKGHAIFAQGDAADSVFYIKEGKIKVTVISKQGKEAVIAILGVDEFLGEGCLIGHPRRLATATAMTDCVTMRLGKIEIQRVLRDEPTFSQIFISHILARNLRVEEDLVDQLFNSTEKRLARLLLLLANFGKEGRPEPIVAKISQETLAEMIGTTRSRVSHFMNKFRKLGFIDYNGHLEVHSSLLSVVLADQPRTVRPSL